MIDASSCSRAEALAGAIALGEATDAERDDYRRHLAACSPCIAALGGEREIERTMAAVAAARDSEVWQPDLRAALRRPSWVGRKAWRIAAGALAIVAIAAGVRVAAIRQSEPAVTVAFHPSPPVAVAMHRAAPAQHPAHKNAAAAAAQAQATRMVVVHNVVTLKRPAPARHGAVASAKRAVPVRGPAAEQAPREVAMRAPSASDRQSVAALRTTQSTLPPDQHAESLAVAPQTLAVRDVAPLGGENALVPWLPAIAYSENAQGTTAFEVSVDERGVPVKCTITKASGYLVLDEAVCRAAMRARYSPRTVNGRAVAGSYRDAFTFRSSDDQ